jgi:Protein of unknown function (DUF3485)
MSEHFSHSDASSLPKFLALLGLGLAITVATGLVYGRASQRWGPAPDLAAAAKQLAGMPTEIGNWQVVNNIPMDDDAIRMLQCAGYVNRQYVNSQTGENVNVAITLGPSGPISVHTPEICYSSRDYTLLGDRKRFELPGSVDGQQSFWKVLFHPNNGTADSMAVCYAWTAGNRWEASDHPRFEFAGQTLLYKLQIASIGPEAAVSDKEGPCERFLSDLKESGWKVTGSTGRSG